MTRHFAPLLVLPLALSTAFAQETDASAIKISGFGTGALTWTDTDDAQFARTNQASGAGQRPRTGVDSNLGLQVDARVNDWLSLTGQGLVRKAGEDDYGAEAMLAFAKARLSDSVSVRVGRVGLPVFMVSDYRNVGYANIMLRAPQEVYNLIPISTLDGADVTWQQNLGDTSVTTQLGYGRTSETGTGGGTITVSNHSILNVAVEHGPFTVRLGRDDGKLEVANPYFRIPKTKVSFTSVGFGMDWNNIVLQSEVARTRGAGPGQKAWYLMGGYRVGKFVPYYSHGKANGSSGQSTDSVGVRWDAFSAAALKFQFDHVKPQGAGMFIHAKPGFRGPVNVGAVSVDFVF